MVDRTKQLETLKVKGIKYNVNNRLLIFFQSSFFKYDKTSSQLLTSYKNLYLSL